jgi:N-acetyl-gamma-glutamyl-phosphate reductase
VSTRVFIDGQEGTTGLQIHERLRARADLELLEIPAERRKDPDVKREILQEAALAILCLPDDAALETVRLAGPNTRLLDASTAHRVHPDFCYGLPELCPEQRDSIRAARRVSNPGCWPTGFLLLVRPLTDAGILPRDYPVSVHGQSGYSGGGKKMIADFQAHPHQGPSPSWTVRPYALDLHHKHVPEMLRYSGLATAPLFSSSVGQYYQGMLVQVPLHTRALVDAAGLEQIHAVLSERYRDEPFVRVMPLGGGPAADGGKLDATALNASNLIELFVFGHAEYVLLVARLDNLGKGAAGAAVQNLNLMLGYPERTGLEQALES